MLEHKNKLETLVTDIPAVEISAAANRARKKLTYLSLTVIFITIFSPSTTLLELLSFKIETNQDALPFAAFIIILWLMHRYYKILKLEQVINHENTTILEHYVSKTPSKKTPRYNRIREKYYDDTALKIFTTIEKIPALFYAPVIEFLNLFLSTIHKKNEWISKKTQDLMDQMEGFEESMYMTGNGPHPDDLDDLDDRINFSVRQDRQQSSASDSISFIDIRFPLVLGFISLILLGFN